MDYSEVLIGVGSAIGGVLAYGYIGQKVRSVAETFSAMSAYVKSESGRNDRLNILLGKIAEECASTRKAAEVVRDTVTNAVAGTVPGVDPQVQRYLAMVEGWRQQGMDQGEAEKLAADTFIKEMEGQF